MPCYHKFYFYFQSTLLAYSPFALPTQLLLTLPVSIMAAGPLTQLVPYLHIYTCFTVTCFNLCLPLSAGEDTFELHSVQLELEAVERQIHEQLGKQAQLRERRAILETSRADAPSLG